MKRLKLLTVVAMSAMCANAQVEFTNKLFGTWEYLPAEISSNGSGDDYMVMESSSDYTNVTFDIYDKDFNKVTSIKTDKTVTKIYSYTYDHHYPLTQKVFNDDDKFEYAVKTDNGFDIYSEDGNLIQSVDVKKEIDNQSGFDEFDLMLYTLKLNDKYYLAAEIYNYDDGEAYWTLFYSINKESTRINNANAPLTLVSVTPHMANRSEAFTVKLDGNSTAQRTVTVNNMAGQTVWQKTIPAGETEVRVSASRLNKGLNIINVSGDGNNESCKVIVK